MAPTCDPRARIRLSAGLRWDNRWMPWHDRSHRLGLVTGCPAQTGSNRALRVSRWCRSSRRQTSPNLAEHLRRGTRCRPLRLLQPEVPTLAGPSPRLPSRALRPRRRSRRTSRPRRARRMRRITERYCPPIVFFFTSVIFIERDPSGLQRRRPPVLPTRIPQRPHPLRQNRHLRLRLRRPLRLSTPTRLTRREPTITTTTRRPPLPSNRRLRQHRNPLSSSRRQIRTSSSTTSVFQTYVTWLVFLSVLNQGFADRINIGFELQS